MDNPILSDTERAPVEPPETFDSNMAESVERVVKSVVAPTTGTEEDEWVECEDDDQPVVVWWWRWRKLVVMVIFLLAAGLFYLYNKYMKTDESESNAEETTERVTEKEQYANGSVSESDGTTSKQTVAKSPIVDNEESVITQRHVSKISEEKVDIKQSDTLNEMKKEKGETKSLSDETAAIKTEAGVEQHPVEITITNAKDFEVPSEKQKLKDDAVNQTKIVLNDVSAVEMKENKIFTASDHVSASFDNKESNKKELNESATSATDGVCVQENQNKLDSEVKPDTVANDVHLERQTQTSDSVVIQKKPTKKLEDYSSSEEVSESLSEDDKHKAHAIIIETVSNDEQTDKKPEPNGIVVTPVDAEDVMHDDFKSVPVENLERNALTDSTNSALTDSVITIVANQNADDNNSETFISQQKSPQIVDQYDHDEYESSEEQSNQLEKQDAVVQKRDDIHDKAGNIEESSDEKSRVSNFDEINMSFSLKNLELQKSQGLHNAAVEGELATTHAAQPEFVMEDLPKSEIELSAENEVSLPRDESNEVEVEELVRDSAQQDEVEVSEEFGENTTAPEIESYEAVVEAETEISEKEVDDVELGNLEDFEQIERDEKQAEVGGQIQDDNNILVEESHSDHQAQRPSFITSKAPVDTVHKVYENGAPEDNDEISERCGGNSILEVTGANNIAEVLMKMDTLEAVAEVMRMAGLESSNLIFGIDYTASNKYQGEMCFGGKSLHTVEPGILNPYQQVIAILGKTLVPFASSGFIAAYGFGDVKSTDESVFPLRPHDFCQSFEEVLDVYNIVTPKIILSGPTNFAPLIYQAMDICKQVKDYHILVIVADGQVTNERATRRAIVDACKFPLSIVVVGVGDGPWDMMRVFDDSLPKRPWDNFHFVEFHQITNKVDNPDLAFAVQSLLEIPDQYKKIKAMGLLNFPDDD